MGHWQQRILGVGGRLAPALVGRWAANAFLTPQRVPKPRWEIDLGGVPLSLAGLHALRWGEGPTVLLVHGWNGRGTQMGRFVGPLVRAGFRAVALDGPAHGQSPGKQTNMASFADELVRVGKELGPLAGVIGHSFGGSASVLAAKRGLLTKKVVTIGSPCHIEKIFRDFSNRIGLPPPAYEAFLREVEKRSGITIPNAQVGLWAPAGLGGLVVHAEDDDWVPFSEAVALSAQWENATLLPLAAARGLGHHKILKDEQVASKVVEFLARELLPPS